MTMHKFSFFFALLLSLSLFGCNNGPIETLNFESPEKDRSIKVTGERNSPAGPIEVTVTLTVPGGTKPFSFQHQAGSLTSENCKAEWNGNTMATLTFGLDDGESWEVKCNLNDNLVQAVKTRRPGIDGIFD